MGVEPSFQSLFGLTKINELPENRLLMRKTLNIEKLCSKVVQPWPHWSHRFRRPPVKCGCGEHIQIKDHLPSIFTVDSAKMTQKDHEEQKLFMDKYI